MYEWNLYFDRLVNLARKKFGITPRATYDEEDVALSAFKSLCKGVRNGQVADDMDRDHLWKLMATITLRKVYDCIRHQNRQKRNPVKYRETRKWDADPTYAINELVAREPTPALTIQMEDEFQQMLNSLVHVDLQEISILKLEGFTNREIADRMGCGLSTVERKLRTIRQIWNNSLNGLKDPS